MDTVKRDIKKLKLMVKLLFVAILITSIGCGLTVFWFYYHPFEKVIVI